ncbi:hypothetical protein PoB_002768700 [Plakobranchus ocellatus]|uniref:Uncharacterized protein n=1 Tax=Plakobranchus ocellatus TaxID=259542 RepID=A0AAV4A2S4_9GAST|nr:hypothetical protein PoB_002768700 [Plakobranchus ocellatus]
MVVILTGMEFGCDNKSTQDGVTRISSLQDLLEEKHREQQEVTLPQEVDSINANSTTKLAKDAALPLQDIEIQTENLHASKIEDIIENMQSEIFGHETAHAMTTVVPFFEHDSLTRSIDADDFRTSQETHGCLEGLTVKADQEESELHQEGFEGKLEHPHLFKGFKHIEYELSAEPSCSEFANYERWISSAKTQQNDMGFHQCLNTQFMPSLLEPRVNSTSSGHDLEHGAVNNNINRHLLEGKDEMMSTDGLNGQEGSRLAKEIRNVKRSTSNSLFDAENAFDGYWHNRALKYTTQSKLQEGESSSTHTMGPGERAQQSKAITTKELGRDEFLDYVMRNNLFDRTEANQEDNMFASIPILEESEENDDSDVDTEN